VIYDDALAGGWVDWSWGITQNLATSSPVHTGARSISVTITTGYAGLKFHSDAGVATNPYTHLEFAIRGTTTGYNYRLIAANPADATLGFVNNPCPVPNGSWTVCQVGLNSLGAANAYLSGITWLDLSGAGQPLFYLDQVRLVASGPSTVSNGSPTPTPTPVPSASPTPSPSSTPGPAATCTAPGVVPVPNVTVPAVTVPPAANALWVSPSGNDSHPGTQAQPKRTIQAAVNAAGQGQMVVVRCGDYREKVTIARKGITLQAAPGEQVWVKGSDLVSGWVVDGGRWRKDGWTYEPAFATGNIVGPDRPVAGYPDQVFIDGQPQTQVLSLSAVKSGTFFHDRAANRLYVGSDPNGRRVEVTARANTGEIFASSGTTIRGIGWAHAASKADSSSGSVIVHGGSRNTTVDGATFAYNAASGFQIGDSDRTTVRRSILSYNGLVGLDSWGNPSNVVVEFNTVRHNNTERFNQYWSAAGIKLMFVKTGRISDNVVERNNASGIWCDESCENVQIVRNLVRDNSLHGIMFEISGGAIIASNVVAGHTNAAGIYVSDSTNAKVYNNTLYDNRRSVAVHDGPRVNYDSAAIGRGVTWVTANVMVQNNLYLHPNGSPDQVFITYTEQNDRTAEQMVAVNSNNAIWRANTSSPANLSRWARAYQSELYYATLSAWQSATGREQGSRESNGGAEPWLVNAAGGDYRLKSGAAVAGMGAPLPADVAAVIGVAAGVAVNPGALAWPSPN
jgi:hypothetical protein